VTANSLSSSVVKSAIFPFMNLLIPESVQRETSLDIFHSFLSDWDVILGAS
jgi:hypothetical protein